MKKEKPPNKFSPDQEINDDLDLETLKIPKTLPLLPVRDIVVFPHMIIPLYVGRESSIRAVEKSLASNRLILLATQKNPQVDDPEGNDLYKTGTVVIVIRMLKMPDERIKILVQGVKRAKLLKVVNNEVYLKGNLNTIEESEPDASSLKQEAMMRICKETIYEMIQHGKSLPPDFMVVIENLDSPGKLADLVIANLNLKVKDLQEVLELTAPLKRLKRVIEILKNEFSLLKVQSQIQTETQQEIGKTQRDYYLREQLKAIKKELGDYEDKADEIEEFQEKIKKAKMPKKAKEEANKQLKRMGKMHPESAEATTVRTFLEWMVELPWSILTKDNLDIKKASKTLNNDHFGLEKIKDRILEHLSVKKLNKNMKGPILCFVGPPGVGKTSLGRSIARSMEKKFIRISLGGVRDEAEIRGHRRTYVGALPGRVIQGLKTAGSSNPIFMLDEIDKIGTDFRGDPSSALLEVLDPEQNNSFTDHYLGVEYDLSKVMFIATANIADPIPSALKDRMEIIRLSGYTLEEKFEIAKRYLIPRVLKENGIEKLNVSFSKNAIIEIITFYTREAGLRNLERKLSEICRKIARLYAENKFSKKYEISKAKVNSLLGPQIFIPETDLDFDRVGTATGLAWTSVGGEILHIEVVVMKGKGVLSITGQLGDVMKESAKAALSYIRSKADLFGISPDIFSKHDYHIHVPAGGIPKDGPSAGITITTALISAFTKVPVQSNFAMTGEITLRGRVLPIGGLKEKSLAALSAGITNIIIPKDNEKDLPEIPPYIRKKLNFISVKNYDEIVNHVLPSPKKKKTTRKKK
ncbi:MAG: endopeptidase La [Nitrospinae bacterium]|nr:endopeptidase La [Nitrospinota bacterium]